MGIVLHHSSKEGNVRGPVAGSRREEVLLWGRRGRTLFLARSSSSTQVVVMGTAVRSGRLQRVEAPPDNKPALQATIPIRSRLFWWGPESWMPLPLWRVVVARCGLCHRCSMKAPSRDLRYWPGDVTLWCWLPSWAAGRHCLVGGQGCVFRGCLVIASFVGDCGVVLGAKPVVSYGSGRPAEVIRAV